MKNKCFIITDFTFGTDIIVAICTSIENTKKHLYNYCNDCLEIAKKCLSEDEIGKEKHRLATIVEYFDKYFEGIEDAISAGRGAVYRGISIEIYDMD